MPSWLPQAIQVAGLLVAGAVAWTTLSGEVRDMRRDVDGQGARIGSLEDGRGRVQGLEERVNWAAGNAADAKKLAETLLTDRLGHTDCGIQP